MEALPPAAQQRVVVAGDMNLDVSATRDCPERLRAPDCREALERCRLHRVVPRGDPGTTLDAIKKEPGGAIDHVWLHEKLRDGVPQPSAAVVPLDEVLVQHAAQRVPPISREWLREGLCTLGSADGANDNLNTIHAMKKLGWPDHRPLIVDMWAKDV